MFFVRPPKTLYVALGHRGPLQHGIAWNHLVDCYLRGPRLENTLAYNILRKLTIDHDDRETSSVIKFFTAPVHTKKVSESEIGNPANIGVEAAVAARVQPIVAVEDVSPRIALNRIVERAAIFQGRLLNMNPPQPLSFGRWQ